MDFYEGEDSYFLSDELKKYLKRKDKKLKILEIGTGAGVQIKTIKELGFNNILAVDISKEVVKNLKKLKIKAIQSDLFSNIKDKFNLIIFNAPYLPEDKYDKEKDTSGGKLGDETIIRFIKKLKSHLTEEGEALLLLSSFTPRKRIELELKKQKLRKRVLAEKKLFFETLEIWTISF